MARGRPRRPPFTREQIMDAAFDIADAEGIEALSMRRLARALGIEASSLYHYVSSRDEVLDGIVTRLRSRVSIPEELPQHWPEAMEVLFTAYASVLTAHPNLVSLAGRHVEGDPQVNGLMYLVAQGQSLDDATDLWQSIHALTIGFALLASAQVAIQTSDLSPPVAERFRQWRPETYRRALRLVIEGHAGAGMTGSSRPDDGPIGTGPGR